jgi:hypothetical protein
MIFPPSYLTDFSHFLSDKNILKIAGHAITAPYMMVFILGI